MKEPNQAAAAASSSHSLHYLMFILCLCALTTTSINGLVIEHNALIGRGEGLTVAVNRTARVVVNFVGIKRNKINDRIKPVRF